MAQSSRRGRRRTRGIVCQHPPPEDHRCYLCDARVARDEEIVRVHEATMHRRCFEEDIRRGRW